MFIVNLTQYPASAEQRAVGVVDLQDGHLDDLIEALTFGELPDANEIRMRADFIAGLAVMNGLGDDLCDSPDVNAAMISGPPWLMAPLAAALIARWIKPLFAFSVCDTEEQTEADGSIRKVTIFRHTGFVSAIV